MNRTIRTVALVEPAVEAEFYLTALFAQMRCQFPLLQAELRAHGYRPRIFAETLGAFDEHTLGEIAGHDVIAVSDTVTTHRRTAELLAELRRRNPEAVVVLGGILVKFFADLALEHAVDAHRPLEGQRALELRTLAEIGIQRFQRLRPVFTLAYCPEHDVLPLSATPPDGSVIFYRNASRKLPPSATLPRPSAASSVFAMSAKVFRVPRSTPFRRRGP